MPKILQILRSSDLESRERHVQRLKKEIDDLSVTLEINMDALAREKTKQ